MQLTVTSATREASQKRNKENPDHNIGNTTSVLEEALSGKHNCNVGSNK